MRRLFVALALLCLTVASTNAFAQSVNGSFSGTVQDSSKALIPGVQITLTNTETGIVNKTLSNESGTYGFVQVPPGLYNLQAELPGFKTSVLKSVRLNTSGAVRQDFTLEVGAAGTRVEVTVDAQVLLRESSASIGEVLPEERLHALPLIGNDILSLLGVMPGVVGETFAGVSASMLNTVRDGLSVTDGRFQEGAFTTTMMNPDLIGEVRIILTPVDAELGRGNGQILITTRSGTNKYNGAAVWNVVNTALNPNSWANNNDIDAVTGLWNPTKPNWLNQHDLVASYGGPIVKNKTFFFGDVDIQRNYQRNLVSASALTVPARNGIFRYFDGYNPGNAQALTGTISATSTNLTAAAVDFTGSPIKPQFNPVTTGGVTTPYSGAGLMCFSVFGPNKMDGKPFTQADCPGGTAILTTTAWDSLRTAGDTTGAIQKIIALMPATNFYGTGATDGLNQAIDRWVRGRHSNNSAAVTIGSDQNTDRNQYNLKIDQNFSSKHRLSGGWSLERVASANDISSWQDALALGLGYATIRHAQVLTVNMTSTLSSTIVNEARYGLRYNHAGVDAPWERPATKELAQSYMAKGSNGYLALLNPTLYGGNVNGVIVSGPGQYNGNTSPLNSYGDTLSWTRGRHAFKFGAEARFTGSNGYNNIPQLPFPVVSGGAGGNTSALVSAITTGGVAGTGIPGLQSTSRTNAANLLYFLNGSVNNASMLYWIASQSDVTNGTWQDVTTAQNGRKYRNTIENEGDFFIKDDWKASKNLTLNLGIRWEYYGSSYIKGGFTTTSGDKGYGLFGAGRTTANPFDNWLITPGNLYLSGYGPNVAATAALQCSTTVAAQAGLPTPTCDPSKLTQVQFVGPGTTNPKQTVIPNDYNNFGPAIGFAWTSPFGMKNTTVRGGYQISFGGSGRLVGGGGATSSEVAEGGAPGALLQSNTVLADFPTLTTGRALTLADIPALVPVRPSIKPGGALPAYTRAGSFTSYDPNFRVPYTENFNLSVTTNVRRNVTVDLRYVATMGKKQPGSLNPNLNNVFYNKELFDALTITRAGLDAPLFDQMLAGLDLHGTTGTGYGPVGTFVNGVLQHGSAQLRRSATFQGSIANGNFLAVANSLQTLSTVTGTTLATGALQPLPAGVTGVSGRVMRNGCDQMAAGKTTVTVGGTAAAPINMNLRCFPENYMIGNPQFGGTLTYVNNGATSIYHSLQSQVTLRATQGLSFQETFTYANTMSVPGSGYNDPLNMRADYGRSGAKFDFRSNGTFELPIGPNKFVMGNSHGVIARAIEKWQTSFIYNVSSGSVSTVTGTAMAYGGGYPDIVGNFNPGSGHYSWNGPNNASATYYGFPNPYIAVQDGQCQVTNHTDLNGLNLYTAGTNGASTCTLTALAIRNADGTAGPTVLQTAQPGKVGTLGPDKVYGLGSWTLNANISKAFKVSESKLVTVRIDSNNVLNHPIPGGPNLAGNSSNFGQITAKTGGRTFQGSVRFAF